ncbi:WXG100 family type VII secretion target [Arthrobacter sp. ISL-48]|uniref:WXG100 family type VII secretion target n=1 Tax=Arthrobacter sp. ISL-48 TaxID=2819110 RepID=UPI001BE74C56|nr:WXG100 family type VII secretion target [Arthrobacter sp. ISL-48]MBT2533900.1 WXG100 family type VII secretion target [Arthrobacter sp. ISL-48]
MADVRVDGAALEGFSGSLSAHAGELERRVLALQARAGQVLGSSWQGTTADELNSTFSRWVHGSRGVWEALTALSTFAGVSASTFTITDESLAKIAAAATGAAGVAATPPAASSVPSRERAGAQ